MSAISQHMIEDHRACDELFAEAEARASKGEWAAARTGFAAFVAAMERHLDKEESILFPAFEQRTGAAMGPTQVMRMEHQQMRGLMAQMEAALHGEDTEAFLGTAETLLMLMQQHNVKEEQILYPMTDQVLGDTPVAAQIREA